MKWGLLSLETVTVLRRATGGLTTFFKSLESPKFSCLLEPNRVATCKYVSLTNSFYPRQFLNTFLNDKE